jgi:hypothetical protein
MKILFPTNSWLYDIMIRSHPIWRGKGIDIAYDLLLTHHLDYLTKHLSSQDRPSFSSFPVTALQGWTKANISHENIERLEEKYDIRLPEMMIYDISMVKYNAIPFDKMRNEEYWRRYFVTAVSYYETLLSEMSPDFIFGEGPNGLGMKVLFEVSRKMGIPYITMAGSYVQGMTMFLYGRTAKSFALPYFYRQHQQLTAEDFHLADEIINNVRIHKQMAYYQRNYGKRIRLFPKRISKAFALFAKSVSHWKEKRDPKGRIRNLIELQSNPLWNVFVSRWIRYNNYRYVKRRCVKQESLDNYVVFFNHFQPEATTSVYAPYYENQDEVIENIIKSLGGTVQLYIKEHSTDLGNRGKTFYEKLVKHPSVKIIDPLANTIDLLEGCRMAFTISGTVGLEAIMLKRPVGVFSDCYYSLFPGVMRISSPENIPAVINWGMNEFKSDEASVRTFVAAYVRSLYPTFVTYPHLEDEAMLSRGDNLVKFVDGILSFIEDYKVHDWERYIKCDDGTLARRIIA